MSGLIGALPLLLAAPAHAQEADPPAENPFRLAEAVGAPEWLTLEGSVRSRVEALSNPFESGVTDDQLFLSFVGNLKAEAKASDFVLGAELHDARVLAEDGGAAASEVDTLEFIQAYLAWRPKSLILDGDELDLRAGRVTLDIGSRRLVARASYRNIVTQFEGVSAHWTTAQGIEARAFAVSPLARRPDDDASALDNEVADNQTLQDTHFKGLLVSVPVVSGIDASGFVYHLEEDDSSDAETRNRDLLTWGARLLREPDTRVVDFDVEYARQTGEARRTTSPADLLDIDHDAEMAHAEIGYTFDGPREVRISAIYDYATGDANPADSHDGRFDALFGDRSFEFGPTSLFGVVSRANLSSPAVRIEAKVDDASDVLAMLRRVDLDSARDSHANSGVRDPSGLSGDQVGTLMELRYRRWLLPESLQLQTGLAWLSRGEFLKRAPNANHKGDPLYGYLMVTLEF